jgi:hypothetical protein
MLRRRSGPLSKAHRDLEGPLQCAKCRLLAGTAQLRCRECHGEIARKLSEKRSYHALQAKLTAGSNDSGRYHSEHNGVKHQVVKWPVAKEKFNTPTPVGRSKAAMRSLNAPNIIRSITSARATEGGCNGSAQAVPNNASSGPESNKLSKSPHHR